LRRGDVRVAKNDLRDFRRNAQTEEHRRKPPSESMPAMPPITNDGFDFTSAEIIQMQRSAHLLTSEDPLATYALPPMGVDNRSKRSDDGDGIL
jgi:hypothetical protein